MFPSDYVEEWGRKYGIGLGPVPVSEALVNDYDKPVVVSATDGTAMHPLGVCRAQVDLVSVTEKEYAEKKAILQLDDINMGKRAVMMRTKQIAKSPRMKQLTNNS
jgi:hypothetical protein